MSFCVLDEISHLLFIVLTAIPNYMHTRQCLIGHNYDFLCSKDCSFLNMLFRA